MTTDAVGGIWTYSLDLARGLVSHGIETTLAVFGPSPSSAQRAHTSSVVGLRLIEADAAPDWMCDNAASIIDAGNWTASLARTEHAAIVQYNTPALAAAAQLDAPLVGGCHSCLATWWDAVQGDSMPDDFRWRTDLLARGYHRCDRLVAPTHAFAAATAAAYDILPAVVHNGAADMPMAIGARDRRVLAAGRLWDLGKNAAALDDLAGLVDAPVELAGPLASPRGEVFTPRHAIPLGPLDAVSLRRRMSQSAIFASLALYEPFGLAVLEAAQAGCALLLSDIASFRELWDGAAMFVAAGDRVGAAKALQGLLDDPLQAARCGHAARERARRYTAERMARAMVDVYRGLPQTGRAAA